MLSCDRCFTDYSSNQESGGFIFGIYAYCPRCADSAMANITQYNNKVKIKAICPPTQSFADFIREWKYKESSDYALLT